jgi:hypothetical protein
MAKLAAKYDVYADKIRIGSVRNTGKVWHLQSTAFQFPYSYPSFESALRDCIDCQDFIDETFEIKLIPISVV